MMNNHQVRAATFCLIGGVLVLSGCSKTETQDNRLTITSSNATSTVATAVSSTNVVLSDFPAGAETARAPSALDIVYLAGELSTESSADTLLSTPTGIMENRFCDSGVGNFSNDYSSESMRRAGSISFTGCNLAGVVLDGELSYELQWSEPSGPYSYDFSGNVTAAWNNIVTTVGNLDYSVSGDDGTGEYTVSAFNNSVGFSNGRGFTVSLTDPVTGNEITTPACPLAGAILVTGANGTRARGTIVYPEVNIEYDAGSGTFAPVETVPCTEIFPVERPFLLRHHTS